MLKKILLFCGLVFALNLWAGGVRVSQWIPWGFLSTEMKKTPIAIQKSQSSVSMALGQLTPVATSVQVAIHGNLDAVALDHTGISAKSDQLTGTVVINNLSINQTLASNIGGNHIQVKVAATCAPITITINQFSSLMGGTFVPDQTSWNLNLTSVALNFPDGKWSIGAVTCSGLNGIDQDITNTVAANLKNPAVLQEFLKAELAPVISDNWRTEWSTLLSSAQGNLQDIQMQAPGDHGFHILATLPLSSGKTLDLPAVDDTALSTTAPQLVLSTAGFEAMIADKLMAKAPQKYNLQQVSGFSGLAHNRIEQFLVWPDLMSFSTSAPFYLNTNTAASTFSLVPKAGGGYSSHTVGKGGVDVTKNSTNETYLDWSIDLTADLTCTLKDSNLTLQTGKPTSAVKWNFNANYVKKYAPNTRVSSSVLTNAIQSAFTAQSATQTLPTLKWQGRQWKLQSWVEASDHITMDWKE